MNLEGKYLREASAEDLDRYHQQAKSLAALRSGNYETYRVQFVWVAAGVYFKFDSNGPATFSDGTELSFTGTAYGSGSFGGGTCFGTGYTIPLPTDLPSLEIAFQAVLTPVATYINFSFKHHHHHTWHDAGEFTGGGIGVGGGLLFHGSGSWEADS